jgi:hypothetical protein
MSREGGQGPQNQVLKEKMGFAQRRRTLLELALALDKYRKLEDNTFIQLNFEQQVSAGFLLVWNWTALVQISRLIEPASTSFLNQLSH